MTAGEILRLTSPAAPGPLKEQFNHHVRLESIKRQESKRAVRPSEQE